MREPSSPGWYPDPGGGERAERYWNGHRWSERRGLPEPPPVELSPAEQSAVVRQPWTASRLFKRAIVLVAALLVLYAGIVVVLNARLDSQHEREEREVFRNALIVCLARHSDNVAGINRCLAGYGFSPDEVERLRP